MRSVFPRCSPLSSTPRNSPRKTGDANSALSPPTSKPLTHLFCFGAKPHHDCVITITRAVRDHVRPDPCKPDSWRANIGVASEPSSRGAGERCGIKRRRGVGKSRLRTREAARLLLDAPTVAAANWEGTLPSSVLGCMDERGSMRKSHRHQYRAGLSTMLSLARS